MKNTEYYEAFTRPIIKYGRITNLGAILMCFIPAITIATVFGAMPPVKDILAGWALVFAIYGIFSVIEPVSYFPVLGVPGTYLSFLSGNIGNMRLPCSAIAQEAMGIEFGTEKAEIVSTLAISGSIVTNLVATTIAAAGGAALMALFPPIVIDALGYVSPAIFGAIFAMYFAKNPLYGTFALVLTMSMFATGKIKPAVMLPVAVFATVGFGFWQYSMKKKKAEGN